MDEKGVIKDMANTTNKSGTTTKTTAKPAAAVDNKELDALKASFAELKAQNELLLQLLKERANVNTAPTQVTVTNTLNAEYTLIHLIEREAGLTTHIELTNLTIDMSAFGEERLLDRRQCEELAGKYRRWFEKGIIAFGADGEELANKFGLKSLNDYSYIKNNKNFVKQLGILSLSELEDLYNKVCEGHKKFIIEYFKIQIVKGDPAFKDIHKIELLNRVSNGAMSGTTLDLKREAEETAKKDN